MPGVSVLAVSRYRETRPVGGPPGQDPYLNGACLIETQLGPHDTLGMLSAVENTLHRERHCRWDSRTIDLDLLLYDDLVLDEDRLTVPHPRMATRRFVLEPSVEIAPALRHPLAGCTIADLLDNISAPHPLVVVVGVPGSGAADVASAVADATLARAMHAPSRLLPPATAADAAAWRRLLDSWIGPLEAAEWRDDPHGTIADFWLGAIPTLAAADLPAAEVERLAADVERAASRTMCPQVAILLYAEAATLEERVLAAPATSSADVRGSRKGIPRDPEHSPIVPGGRSRCREATTIERPPEPRSRDRIAALLRMQDGLCRALSCPGERSPLAPKAVVCVASDDLSKAVDEAVAAVEAMI